MKVETIIGAAHLFIIMISGIFFLFPKSKLDLVFLIIIYGTFLSWTVFKGRCVISYLVRHTSDVSTKTMDIYRLFPRSKESYVAFGHSMLNKLKMVSVFIVLWRNNFNVLLMIMPLLIYNFLKKNILINVLFFCLFAIQMATVVHLLFGWDNLALSGRPFFRV